MSCDCADKTTEEMMADKPEVTSPILTKLANVMKDIEKARDVEKPTESERIHAYRQMMDKTEVLYKFIAARIEPQDGK